MRKPYAIFMALMIGLTLAGCQGGKGSASPETAQTRAEAVSETAVSDEVAEAVKTENPETEGTEEEKSSKEEAAKGDRTETTGNGILVAYFTYGENGGLPDDVDASSSASIQLWNGEVTGNMGLLAHMVADQTGGDLFSIRTVDPYPSDYEGTIDRGQAENSANARPELATHIENPEDYDTIFLGFPNWWYDLPMAMYTFLEEYDLSGKKIIPFVTSGGSGFSGTVSTIQELQPGAEVIQGISIGAGSAAGAQSQVEQWVESLGY